MCVRSGEPPRNCVHLLEFLEIMHEVMLLHEEVLEVRVVRMG